MYCIQLITHVENQNRINLLIMDIHNCICASMCIRNSIMDIHNISEVYGYQMTEFHNWIMDIHNWVVDVHG